jgi:hypothetical protein
MLGLLFHLEHGGSRVLQNAGNDLPHYTALILEHQNHTFSLHGHVRTVVATRVCSAHLEHSHSISRNSRMQWCSASIIL